MTIQQSATDESRHSVELESSTDSGHSRSNLIVRWAIIVYLSSYLVWSRSAEKYFERTWGSSDGYYLVSFYLVPHPGKAAWIFEFTWQAIYWPLIRIDRFLGMPTPGTSVPMTELS